jgi:hypothetical protein
MLYPIWRIKDCDFRMFLPVFLQKGKGKTDEGKISPTLQAQQI